MTDYLLFRELLARRCMVFYFNDEAETYEITQVDCSGTSGHPLVSIPAHIARYDIVAARELIDTAHSLHTLFGL